jgi:hypothetical protein
MAAGQERKRWRGGSLGGSLGVPLGVPLTCRCVTVGVFKVISWDSATATDWCAAHCGRKERALFFAFVCAFLHVRYFTDVEGRRVALRTGAPLCSARSGALRDKLLT